MFLKIYLFSSKTALFKPTSDFDSFKIALILFKKFLLLTRNTLSAVEKDVDAIISTLKKKKFVI